MNNSSSKKAIFKRNLSNWEVNCQVHGKTSEKAMMYQLSLARMLFDYEK